MVAMKTKQFFVAEKWHRVRLNAYKGLMGCLIKFEYCQF